jgi:hypothetical protein
LGKRGKSLGWEKGGRFRGKKTVGKWGRGRGEKRGKD